MTRYKASLQRMRSILPPHTCYTNRMNAIRRLPNHQSVCSPGCLPQPRLKEQDLLALSPLVRLLWGTLMNELLTTYDTNQGDGCKPVLLLIDEASKTAIPSLSEHAATVVGRGIYLWIAVQSLSQLEAAYGR